jgi:hypothetical protein
VSKDIPDRKEAAAIPEAEPDMSWFDIAVDRKGNVMVLDWSADWDEWAIEPNWEDTFEIDAPSHLAPGAYRWSGFKVGYSDEDEALNVTGGSFAKADIATPKPASATPDIFAETYALASVRPSTGEGERDCGHCGGVGDIGDGDHSCMICGGSGKVRSKSITEFLAAIRAADPNGQGVVVKLHPNDDWTVFDRKAQPPLSDSRDDRLREKIARIVDPYVVDDGSHVSHMAWQIALGKADSVLAALSQQPADTVR